MTGDLGTTNLLLGIMAAVSVLEALLLIGAGIAGVVCYRRAMRLADELESRHIAPLREQIDQILADVREVTARVNDEAGRVDDAIHGAIDRVDEAAERVRATVRHRVSHVIGIAHGIRAVIVSILGRDRGARPPAPAEG